VFSPGRRTCTAREIDFFLVSDVLAGAIVGVEECLVLSPASDLGEFGVRVFLVFLSF